MRQGIQILNAKWFSIIRDNLLRDSFGKDPGKNNLPFSQDDLIDISVLEERIGIDRCMVSPDDDPTIGSARIDSMGGS